MLMQTLKFLLNGETVMQKKLKMLKEFNFEDLAQAIIKSIHLLAIGMFGLLRFIYSFFRLAD
jgi:hypothetical protein